VTPDRRLFVAIGVNPIFPGATFSYPANGGAASEAISGEGAVGYILTRYGGTRPNSEYFSPRGTSIGQRYLLKGTNTETYEEFEILKPFGLEQTQIAGENGLPTGGIQLRTSMPAGQLLNEGYIAPVETPVPPVEIPEFFFIP
jgi:hypothetical protein